MASVNYTLAAGSEVEILKVNATAGLTLTGNEFVAYTSWATPATIR